MLWKLSRRNELPIRALPPSVRSSLFHVGWLAGRLLVGPDMLQRSSTPSLVPVTPHGASQALHALHSARHADNLRIEIAAARVLDAYCQGRLVAAEDVADVDNFLSAHPVRKWINAFLP